MQLIAPYKIKEKDLAKIDVLESLYKNESHNFVDIYRIAWDLNKEKK